MYDHVIWPEPFHPRISAIYGLNDIASRRLQTRSGSCWSMLRTDIVTSRPRIRSGSSAASGNLPSEPTAFHYFCRCYQDGPFRLPLFWQKQSRRGKDGENLLNIDFFEKGPLGIRLMGSMRHAGYKPGDFPSGRRGRVTPALAPANITTALEEDISRRT